MMQSTGDLRIPRHTGNARTSRLVVAIVAALVVVFSSPFVGELRGAILDRFPDYYRLIIGSIVLASTVTLMLIAIVRIRDDRARRYAALGAALVTGFGCEFVLRTGNANVDVVEAFHFVEYGVVALLFYRVWRSNGDLSIFVYPILAGIVVGVLDEWFQWFVPERAGEIRDVLINAVAAFCGVLFSVALDPPSGAVSPGRAGALVRVGGSIAVVVLLATGFFATVHLGYEVRDPEIGLFRARDSAAGLQTMAMERAERWRQHHPLDAAAISREDQYFSEGLWHARRRNEAAEDGDFNVAWRENRILEKYYRPVLDTPSHATSGQQWPPEQRADIESKDRGSGGAFESDANPYPIYIWSKAAFWMTMAGLSGVIFVFFVWLDRRASRADGEV